MESVFIQLSVYAERMYKYQLKKLPGFVVEGKIELNCIFSEEYIRKRNILRL